MGGGLVIEYRYASRPKAFRVFYGKRTIAFSRAAAFRMLRINGTIALLVSYRAAFRHP